jgi:hypothetical protein
LLSYQMQEAADAIERVMGDADANGSSSGSSEDDDPENDEGQEPGYGA